MSTPDKEPTSNNPTCSYPNCHPEGGGEGTFHCQSEIAGEAECAVQCDHCREYYKPFEAPEAQPMEGNYADYYAVHGTCHLHGPYVGQCLICNTGVATTTDSNIEPIADGKEVPTKAQGVEMSFMDIVEEKRKVEAKLFSARNEISTQGEQIARLQLELKAAQGNLTAMIEEALQKSKRLDEVEKEAGEARKVVEEFVRVWKLETGSKRVRPPFAIKIALEFIAKYPSPTRTNKDK